jgi:hypothetical protein
MSRFRTNDTHPLAMIETRSKQKTKDNKEKSNNSHKREMFKNNDLKEPNKMIHRFLMPFTRVPAQSDKERRKQWIDFKFSTAEKLKIKKKATKYEQQGAYSSEGRMSKVNGKKH